MFSESANTIRFQSTLPRRSDTFVPLIINILSGFNPRSREGATVRLVPLTDHIGVSIHAPAKERQDVYNALGWAPEFQSTLPRRSDIKSPQISSKNLRLSYTILHIPPTKCNYKTQFANKSLPFCAKIQVRIPLRFHVHFRFAPVPHT